MKIRSGNVRPRRFLCWFAALGFAVAGCQQLATDLPPSMPLSFAIAVAGGPTDAFDKADRLAVTLSEGSQIVLDTVVTIRSDGGDVQLRLRVPRELDGRRVTLRVELRRGAEPLFTGQSNDVPLSQSAATVEITLTPVVARLEVPATQPTITTVGATTRVSAAAVFATGDTVPNIPITWTAIDRNIVSITTDGTVRALAEGMGRVEARYGTIAAVISVRVRATVTSVTVTPATATIQVGGIQKYTATARDAGGTALVRSAAWDVSTATIASIDTAGNARGLATGTTSVRATIEGVSANASLTVLPPTPAAPGNVAASASGQLITLTWTDNATNETSIEVHRGPAGGTRVRIATLPPNTTLFRDQTALDQVLDYTIRACNSLGCGESAVVTTRTAPLPPSSLTLVVTDSSSGRIVLSWIDGSQSETRFEVQAIDSDGILFKWADVPANNSASRSTTYATAIGLYELWYFRVVACNQAGCSAPTNDVQVYLYGSSPDRTLRRPAP